MVTQRLSLFFFILTVLLGTACGGDTGSGSYDDDDDDENSGDDDDGSGTSPMVLTFIISNSTGYDFTYLNWGPLINGQREYAWENTMGMTNGFVWTTTGTVEDTPYGVAMDVVAYAVDVDGDCYDWEDGGQTFNTGSALSISVDFEWEDFLGSGVPCPPGSGVPSGLRGQP